MEINTSEISVVMQGAVYPITPFAIASVRLLLPDSQIILSTWEGSDLSKIEKNIKVILNRDPHKKGMKYPNNSNRMILSTIEGLKAVQTRYTLKIRTDFYLQNLNFLKLFEENPNTNCGMRFLERRVVCYGWAAQKGRYFQIGDFYHFGLTKDLIDIWDVPLMSNEELFWFEKKLPYNSIYLRSTTNRYHPEQYLWVNFLRKKGVALDFIDYTDSREKHKKLSEDSFADNLIFASFPEFAVYTPKKNLLKYNLGFGSRESDFSDWVRICQERNCDYIPKAGLHLNKNLRRKSKFVYDICRIINVFSSAIPIRSLRRMIRDNTKAHIIKKLLYNEKQDSGRNSSRFFNKVSVNKAANLFIKESSKISKIIAEKKWYESMPDELQKYCPKVLGFYQDGNVAKLTLEYIDNPSLAVLFTREKLSQDEFNSVLASLFETYSEFISHKGTLDKGYDLKKIYLDKTLDRIESAVNGPLAPLISAQNISLNGETISGFPKVKNKLMKKLELIASAPFSASVIHGDLCFSNILFEKKTNSFRFVDPRGSFGDGFGIYGDPRYDIAKLRHSFVGLYDFIIADKFLLNESKGSTFSCSLNIVSGYNQSGLESFFDKLALSYGFNVYDIKLIEAVLFLTMIPLHSENEIHQKAFFLTALKKINDIL